MRFVPHRILHALLEGIDPEELGRKAFAHNRVFIEKYKSYWQSQKDSRTTGVAVVLDAPGIITSNNQLTTLHEVTMNNAVPKESAEYGFLLGIAENVFNQRT